MTRGNHSRPSPQGWSEGANLHSKFAYRHTNITMPISSVRLKYSKSFFSLIITFRPYEPKPVEGSLDPLVSNFKIASLTWYCNMALITGYETWVAAA